MLLSVHFRIYAQSIVVSGNTYTHREALKAWGGRFEGGSKAWHLPNSQDNRDRLQALCAKHGGGELPCFVSEQDGTHDKGLQQIVPSASAENERGLSIAELLTRAEAGVRNTFPYPVWVVGEVQNLGRKEHIYMQLVEAQEGKQQTLSVNAVIWKNLIKPIEERCGVDFLQDGLQIRCLCDVQLYRERGALSLRVRDIDPAFTHGALALAREKLLRELRAAGKDKD